MAFLFKDIFHPRLILLARSNEAQVRF